MSTPSTIKCQECGVTRKSNQFSATVRMRYDAPICNACKYKYPTNGHGKAITSGVKKSEMKVLPCLGTCGKSFLTIPSVRFCRPCKPKGTNDNYTISIGGD